MRVVPFQEALERGAKTWTLALNIARQVSSISLKASEGYISDISDKVGTVLLHLSLTNLYEDRTY